MGDYCTMYIEKEIRVKKNNKKKQNKTRLFCRNSKERLDKKKMNKTPEWTRTIRYQNEILQICEWILYR